MKLQIEGQALRLRLSENELDTLLEFGQLENRITCPNGRVATRQLALIGDTAETNLRGDLMALHIDLPRAAFADFAAERPRRDGFGFNSAGLEISVEVDVRDSRKMMHVKANQKNTRD